MVARVLVTTALEETWPDDGSSILFLGEWCRLHGRRSKWSSLDAVVAVYHWDDRAKLHNDYVYLRGVYEDLLDALSAKLNAVHNVNHSVRYWRILIGPWLGYFVQMLFDRWSMLKRVAETQQFSKVKVVLRDEREVIPCDMNHFIAMFVGDAWNECIYSQILKLIPNPFEKIEVNNKSPIAERRVVAYGFKDAITRGVGRAVGFFARHDKYFFLATGLGLKQSFLLQMRLHQLPKLWKSEVVVDCQPDMQKRKWHLPSSQNDSFVNVVTSLLASHIPIAYLEGYQGLRERVAKLPWPKKPRVAFTSTAFNADDVFKAWVAEKVESGTCLVIGQHGGNYGSTRWSFSEEHELAIADVYLTWGWGDGGKVSPVGNFKVFPRDITSADCGDALMVQMALPRYSYHMYSVPVATGQWESYFNDQCQFVGALPVELQKKILVRLFPHDWEYQQASRWAERFPNIRMDSGKESMAALMRKSRIYISTYNATTYLESMSINFPTIIFWNTQHWELRNSAIPMFDMLESVGIFHRTPESAARHMANVWENVNAWWSSKLVQEARLKFCELYANNTPGIVNRLAGTLESVNSSCQIA
jgi:putative transferase (TIGR04331 family)